MKRIVFGILVFACRVGLADHTPATSDCCAAQRGRVVAFLVESLSVPGPSHEGTWDEGIVVLYENGILIHAKSFLDGARCSHVTRKSMRRAFPTPVGRGATIEESWGKLNSESPAIVAFVGDRDRKRGSCMHYIGASFDDLRAGQGPPTLLKLVTQFRSLEVTSSDPWNGDVVDVGVLSSPDELRPDWPAEWPPIPRDGRPVTIPPDQFDRAMAISHKHHDTLGMTRLRVARMLRDHDVDEAFMRGACPSVDR